MEKRTSTDMGQCLTIDRSRKKMANYAIQLRRGTSAEHSSFTGLVGEITVNTSNSTIHVHDGSTAGGVELATKASVDNLSSDTLIDADADTHIKVEATADSDTVAITAGGTNVMNATSSGIAITGTISATSTITGDLTGTVSSIANHSTTDLAEGTNQYYTDARARGAVSAGGDLSYNSGTGVFSFTERTDAEVRGLVSAGGDLSYNSGTGVFSFTERTDAEVRGLVSVTDAGGDGSLAYNSSTGVITYTGPSAAEVRAHFTGGTGVTITSGSIAIGQAVGTGDNVTFNDLTINGDLTVSGTTTTVNTETINLADNQILLNSNETGTPTQNGGIEIERGTSANKTFVWDETADKWTVGSETMVAGTFEGNLTGAVTGNADTATKWATGRTITLTGDVTGVSGTFDGSGNLSFATTIAANSVALGTDTTGNYVQQGATSGNGISGSVNSEGGTFTVTSNATSANTASTIVFRDGSGNFSAGTISATATQAQYADVAERYHSGIEMEAGTVVCFGGDNEIEACKENGCTRVAGVISTAPAFMMNKDAGDDATHPYVALAGRVPCKVTGTIKKGDMLMASDKEGHAKAGPFKGGAMIGKALENFDGESGVIEVFVNLM